MGLRIVPLSLIVVALLGLTATTARAQAAKAESATASTFDLPRKAVEAMRREVEAKKKQNEAIVAKSRAIAPPPAPVLVLEPAKAPEVAAEPVFFRVEVVQFQGANVAVNPGLIPQ